MFKIHDEDNSLMSLFSKSEFHSSFKNIVKSQIFLDMTKNHARYCHPLMSLSVVGGVSVVVHKLSLKPLGQLEPSMTIQILRSEICYRKKKGPNKVCPYKWMYLIYCSSIFNQVFQVKYLIIR